MKFKRRKQTNTKARLARKVSLTVIRIVVVVPIISITLTLDQAVLVRGMGMGMSAVGLAWSFEPVRGTGGTWGAKGPGARGA